SAFACDQWVSWHEDSGWNRSGDGSAAAGGGGRLPIPPVDVACLAPAAAVGPPPAPRERGGRRVPAAHRRGQPVVPVHRPLGMRVADLYHHRLAGASLPTVGHLAGLAGRGATAARGIRPGGARGSWSRC